MKQTILRLFALTLAVMTFVSTTIGVRGASAGAAAAKPNIVYILADDLGIGDVSCVNSNCAWKTPNIDRLAHEGRLFTDAHSASGVCTPSRYTL
jgi:arylsulfatase A